ncbi:MAG: hypothetical protein SF182_24035 [Deltaproteobacteria bacterium]|nr:hypothetical protein [Deltaproteobacteria bacterium]
MAGPPIAGVGTVSCTFVGKAKIKPKLIIGGTTSPVVTKLGGKLTCSGGTLDGATVIAGKVKGLITNPGPNANDCLGLAAGLPAFTATVKWKVSPGSPKLLPSTVNFAAGGPGDINLAGPGGSIALTINGVGAAGGSFVGSPIVAVAVTDETLAAFTTACTPPSKGLKGFAFTGLNAPSTVDVQ